MSNPEPNPQGEAGATFVLDHQQRLVMASPSFRGLLGRDEEVLGRYCYQVFQGQSPWGQPACRRNCSPFLRAIKGTPVLDHLVVIPGPGGRPLPLSFNLLPLSSLPQSRVAGACHVAGQGPEGQPPLSPPRRQGWLAPVIQELIALDRVNSAIADSSELWQTLDLALDQVLAQGGVEAAEIFLKEGQTQDLVLAAHRGLFRSAFTQITRFKTGQGFPGIVAATRQPLVTQDLIQDSRYLRTRVKERGFIFYMCLPLLAQDGVIGCLNIASRAPEQDMASRLQFLSYLTKPVAAAVELGWLRGQDLVSRYETGPAPGLASGMERVWHHILITLMALGQADGGALSLCLPGAGALKRKAALGSLRDLGCDLLSAPQPASCPALQGQGPVVITSAHRLPGNACRGMSRGLGLVTCLPLIVGHQTLGVISLGSRQGPPWPTRHLSLLSATAGRAALVIKNAQAYLLAQEQISAPDMERLAEEPGPALASLAGGGLQEPHAGPPRLDIRCFGAFRLYRDGELLPLAHFRRRKAATALKVLVTKRNRPVSQDFLMECLWPEADPQAAKNRLQVVIHSLRRTLTPQAAPGQPLILLENGCYRLGLSHPHRLDVDDFLADMRRGQEAEARGAQEAALATYQQAAQLYTGDFLEDEPYSDWCSVERENLRESYISLVKKLASLLAARGDHEGAAGWYRRALAVDKVREEVHRGLMASLWRAGRRDEALRQYLTCRQVLEEELGVAPLPETEELYRSILGGV